MGCKEQIFAIKMIREFMDLDEAYYRVVREAL